MCFTFTLMAVISGPAPSKITNAIFEHTKTIAEIMTVKSLPAVDISTIGSTSFDLSDGKTSWLSDLISIIVLCFRVVSPCFVLMCILIWTAYEIIDCTGSKFTVEVISNTEDYVAMLNNIFDWDMLKTMFARDDFTFTCDGLNGVVGKFEVRTTHTF